MSVKNLKVLKFQHFQVGTKFAYILCDGIYRAIRGKKEKAKIFFSLLATLYSLLKEEGMNLGMKKKECEDKMVEQSLEKQDRPSSGSGPDPCGLAASVRCVIEFPVRSEKGPSKKSCHSGARVCFGSLKYNNNKE